MQRFLLFFLMPLFETPSGWKALPGDGNTAREMATLRFYSHIITVINFLDGCRRTQLCCGLWEQSSSTRPPQGNQQSINIGKTNSALDWLVLVQSTHALQMKGRWESSIKMSDSDLCIPRNKTERPHYFQSRIIMFCLPISTFMYLWAIYIFPGLADRSWEYINRWIHECRNWERGRAVSFLGIHKSVFWYKDDFFLSKHSHSILRGAYRGFAYISLVGDVGIKAFSSLLILFPC